MSLRVAIFAAAGLSALALYAPPASAFESTGNVVADAFLRAVESAGFAAPAAAKVERIADSTVLTTVAAGADGQTTLAIDSVILDSALIDADNTIIARAITYNDVVISAGTTEGGSQMARVALSGVRLPTSGTGANAGAQESTSALLGNFLALTIDDLSARSAAGETLTLSSLALARATGGSDTALGGTIAVEDLVFDLDLFEEPAASELRALGYTALSVDLSGDALWEPATGEAVLSTAALSVADMGTLEFRADATGLTPEFFAGLTTRNADFASIAQTLGAVTLRSVEVSFADDGLTGRLLERTSRNRQIGEGIVINQLTDGLSRLLATLGDPTFSTEVVGTVRGFLETPGRVTVRAEPSQAVSALQLISAAMLNPRQIPALLAISIERQ